MDEYFVPIPDIIVPIQDNTVRVPEMFRTSLSLPILDCNLIVKRLSVIWTVRTVHLPDIIFRCPEYEQSNCPPATHQLLISIRLTVTTVSILDINFRCPEHGQ